MIDPLKLLEDYKKCNDALGDFRKALYEIWNTHPEEYRPTFVAVAKQMWEYTIPATAIRDLHLQMHIYADSLSDYILNEWKAKEPHDESHT